MDLDLEVLDEGEEEREEGREFCLDFAAEGEEEREGGRDGCFALAKACIFSITKVASVASKSTSSASNEFAIEMREFFPASDREPVRGRKL